MSESTILSYKEFLLQKDCTKKIIFMRKISDIAELIGYTSAKELRLDDAAFNELFIPYEMQEQYEDTVMDIDQNLPIIYYGGVSKKSKKFFRNHKINKKNLYNTFDQICFSGNKVTFGKAFSHYSWFPKTVYSKKEALDGAVGFPLVAKIKAGHSGEGIQKFDTKKDLEKSDYEFDLFSRFIDFKREYRVFFCKKKMFIINERIPIQTNEKSIRTKGVDERIMFVYVYQDFNKVDKTFIEEVQKIAESIHEKNPLGIWSLDIVVDKEEKIWVIESSSAMGLEANKMVDYYKAVYEDFYGKSISRIFLESAYKRYVVPLHREFYPLYKKEIEMSPWRMDYDRITNLYDEQGYSYYFNI